ncbi:MAG: hypothetical protein KDA88_13385 [Planctomycetaceae bacterium]|nr:hypothetical protein [Planctomycetaceae bacterium]MCB9953185.1 hypothetical protein [Planctomycetaceae bacterium]
MRTLTIFAVMLCLFAVVATANSEEEKEIGLKEAPKAVQSAVKAFLKLLPEGAELEELVEEQEGDTVVYEAEFEVPGDVEYEVEFSAQGKILEIEVERENESDDA